MANGDKKVIGPIKVNNIIPDALTGNINLDMSTSGNPPGTIIYVAMNSIPTGYIKANGAAISRSTYSALFSLLGITYGAGDGSTTFNLPDLRGQFIRSFDDGKGIDSGRTFGSAQLDDFKSHKHSLFGDAGLNAPFSVGSHIIVMDGTLEAAAGETISSGGSETRPKNIALLACIKY